MKGIFSSWHQRKSSSVVIFHHVVAVVLHGVGAGAFVENGFGLCDLAGFNFFNEVDLIEIINDVMVGKIDKLVCLSEVVDCNDIIAASVVETFDDICADKAGSTGNNKAHSKFLKLKCIKEFFRGNGRSP